MKERFSILKKYFPVSVRGWGVFLAAMVSSALLCSVLRTVTSSDTHVPLIFVLAVLLISLLTEGYFYGLMAAIVSVFAVNWVFTYPYMKLDFTVYGYPLTFLTMLAVGIAVSTLTTRLKAQEKLRIEAEREKTRATLLRAVSHDLRTPLTSISGVLGAVLESGDSLDEQERRRLLQEAKNDAEWMCSMVENLLSVTRISGGAQGGIAKQEELLEEVISETVTKFRRRYPELEIQVSVPEEPLFVMMDAMLIEQVLLNLLDNSVFHGKGTSLVRLDVTRAGQEIEISVSDNGVGVDSSLLPRLFGAHSLLENVSSNDDKRFMGIGLSVCSTIVAAHGGSIRASNRHEGGACFSFTLPLEGDIENDYS